MLVRSTLRSKSHRLTRQNTMFLPNPPVAIPRPGTIGHDTRKLQDVGRLMGSLLTGGKHASSRDALALPETHEPGHGPTGRVGGRTVFSEGSRWQSPPPPLAACCFHNHSESSHTFFCTTTYRRLVQWSGPALLAVSGAAGRVSSPPTTSSPSVRTGPATRSPGLGVGDHGTHWGSGETTIPRRSFVGACTSVERRLPASLVALRIFRRHPRAPGIRSTPEPRGGTFVSNTPGT